MEKKLRIQLFDPEGRMVDDRMVVQDPELSKGPPAPHGGPMRIEFSFDDPSDIQKAKDYLDQLSGNIPIGPKNVRKKLVPDLTDPKHREELLDLAITQTTDQDELIAFLRDKGFRFMMSDFLTTFEFFPDLIIRDRHLEMYQWMLLCKKTAKNPKSDKYDPMLMFGIQLLSEHSEKIVIYLNGEFHKSLKVPVPDKPKEVFKKLGMMRFPDYMEHPERDRFRLELRQLQDNPDRNPSKFWDRWKKWVDNIPAIPQDIKG